MMERLTCKNIEDWNVLSDVSDFDKKGFVKDTPTCKEICDDNSSCKDCPMQKAIDKLADYEDGEETGLIVRLPCKPGTTIYYIYGIPGKTTYTIQKKLFTIFDINEIGINLFLTKEEAEAKIQKMQAQEEEE